MEFPMPDKPSPKTVTFKDNKGRRIKLDANLTIKDLVKMGVRDIRLTPVDAPLLDHWWRSAK